MSDAPITAVAPFGFPELEAEVRRLAAERSEFVYSSDLDGCWYSEPNQAGKPACIWGQALKNLGWTGPMPEGVGIEAVLRTYVKLGMSPGEGRWARQVQILQDRGLAWGEAVAGADRDRLARGAL